MSQPCLPGSTVIVRDQQWRVSRIDAYENCSVVTLDAGGRERLRVIQPFDRVVAIGRSRIVRRKRRAVVRMALAAIAAERPPTGLWTAAAAAIDLLPYQLEPALAVLRGATRLLLADSVGLGKTIQAGLILSELRARGLVERALVLCPAGLRAGWANELQQRFGIACGVIDQSSLAGIAATLPPGVNPWTTHTTVIASIDFVKRDEVMAALAAVPIDIVIADEAHHLTPATDRGAAVHALATRAPWCVLVTATPHSGDAEAFDYLARLGGHGDALTIFRRSRRDAGLAARRRERLFQMRPDAAESEMLDAVEHYTRAIWRGRGAAEPSVQLVAITIARRAASSPLALERTLRRRLALLSSSDEAVQPGLPLEEEEDGDDCGAARLLAVPGLDNDAEERAAIEHILALIRRCDAPAKLGWIRRALRRIDEPAIIFTEYRDTLDAVLAVLPSSARVATISGATPIDQRHAAIDAFNSGDSDVVLATDTAGEGLNLHHRCRLVIDVELPWNPLRLEQRLGRVDRLGQARRVHAWRLLHGGTIESRVLEVLQLRRGRAACLDQPRPIDERDVARMVLGDSPVTATPPASIASTVVAGIDAEHARLARQRRHALGNAPERGAACAVPRRTNRLMALHTITIVNTLGAIVAERPCAHLITFTTGKVASRDAIARIPFALQTSLRDQSDRAVEDAAAQLTPLRQQLNARIAAIRRYLRAAHRHTFQQSLFDGRADRAATAQAAARQGLDAALERRLRSVDRPPGAGSASQGLIAIWPMGRR
jgi:superfamily II DNA or RNA helicase